MSINSSYSTIITLVNEDKTFSMIMPITASMQDALDACSAFSSAFYTTKVKQEKEAKEKEAKEKESKEKEAKEQKEQKEQKDARISKKS